MRTVRAPIRAPRRDRGARRDRDAPRPSRAVLCTKAPRAAPAAGRGAGLQVSSQRARASCGDGDDDAGLPACQIASGTIRAPGPAGGRGGGAALVRRPRTDPTGRRPRGTPRRSAGGAASAARRAAHGRRRPAPSVKAPGRRGRNAGARSSRGSGALGAGHGLLIPVRAALRFLGRGRSRRRAPGALRRRRRAPWRPTGTATVVLKTLSTSSVTSTASSA